MNKEFKTDVSPCKVTDDELKAINRFTVKTLNADEVFTFNVILCDNDIDRDCERFDNAALEKMAELFVGVTGIFNHNPDCGNQTARIFDAAVEKIAGRKNALGEDYICVKAKAYMPRTEKNKDLIAEIEAGIKKEVSVSCAVTGFTCSVCGGDMRYGECSHVKGESYDGKPCYCVLSDVTDAYEWSFVAIPAQVNAGVTKSYSKEFENMEDCIKAIKCGKSIKLDGEQSVKLAAYIEKLESEAKDGRTYREQLTKDAVKFAVLAVPSLDGESIEKMCGGVGTDELVKIRDAFRKKAGDIMPLAPQLKAKKEHNAVDNSEFRF